MEKLDFKELSKNVFINNLKIINSEVLQMIEDSYIEYYGLSNKAKITEVFNKMKLIYMSDNVEEEDLNRQIENLKIKLQEKIDEFREEKGNFKNNTYEEIINYILNDGNLDTEDMLEIKKILIQLGLNYMLAETDKNEEDKKVILYHNNCENNFCIYDEYVKKNCNSSGCSVQNSEEPITYIQIDNDGTIFLQGIIHEIGHALMKDPLYVDEYDEVHFIQGIYEERSSENRMINEIINEYITEEILLMITSKYQVENYLLNTSFGSWYIDIDKLHNNLIKSVYTLLKNEIIKHVISGNPLIIKRIIDNYSSRTFDDINKRYSYLLMVLINQVRNEGKTRNEIFKEVKENIELSNLEISKKNYNDICIGYSNYLKDIQKQQKYVDELIGSGKAKRIN